MNFTNWRNINLSDINIRKTMLVNEIQEAIKVFIKYVITLIVRRISCSNIEEFESCTILKLFLIELLKVKDTYFNNIYPKKRGKQYKNLQSLN